MSSRTLRSRPADHLRLVVPPAAAVAGASGPARATAVVKPKAAIAVGRSFGDWVWQGLGVGAATASASFATYALVFSTGEVVPSGNFNLFARYDRLYQAPATRHGSSPDGATASAADAPSAARADTASADAVDFTPTGSLAAAADPSQANAQPVPAGRSRYNPDARSLPDFKLRDVFDGKALVESRSSLSVVKPGSVLDGAGEVLSIEKHGERWVVLTQNGIIAAQRR